MSLTVAELTIRMNEVTKLQNALDHYERAKNLYCFTAYYNGFPSRDFRDSVLFDTVKKAMIERCAYEAKILYQSLESNHIDAYQLLPEELRDVVPA